MNIPQATRDRSEARLKGVHPVMAAKCRLILAGMEASGFPMLITQGVRTAEYQHELWRQGREIPGPDVTPNDPLGRTVTDRDGFTSKSEHQAKSDGYGYAIDFAFLIDGPDNDGELETPDWDEHRPWPLFGAMGEAHGLIFGGRWKRKDMAHLEMKA